MARKKKRGFDVLESLETLKKGTIKASGAIILGTLALFLILAGLGQAGAFGRTAFTSLSGIFGIGYVLLPLALIAVTVAIFRSLDRPLGIFKWVGAFMFVIAGLGLIHIVLPDRGGFLGKIVASPLVAALDLYGTLLVLSGVLAVSVLIMIDIEFPKSIPKLPSLPFGFGKKSEKTPNIETYGDSSEEDEDEEGESPALNEGDELEEQPQKVTSFTDKPIRSVQTVIPYSSAEYTPPPLSLLEKDKGKPGVGDTKANANIIKRTLQNFGINVEMDEISVGPTVTRYALKPAEGVRISKIVSLQNNLELALAAHPVRIEAPIPGKSLVGIEIPNSAKATLGLASLLGGAEFSESGKPLLSALGRDISGAPHYANIAKMPHLLIAGTTGSGKSVAIHTLITSLLYRNGPSNLRFIMVDPKRVELTLYNSIPHLLTPVITDAKRAIQALKWAAREMERRYNILETEMVRDISSYHENVIAKAVKETNNEDGGEPPDPMPYIVVIIDELADIMSTYPRELEGAIVRLAQMSRAVGIHLVLSTQRPSVNVITGLIKANIPARVALQVSSQIDSRTILDQGGAEKLLGAGDMLFLSGEMNKPTRIQGPYISEQEVKRVVNFIAKQNEGVGGMIDISEGDQGNALFSNDLEEGDDDDLYEEAREAVARAGKASTSYLQRKLRVGYSRAARLMDLLEERGVIGPQDGAKPREVLASSEKTDGEEREEP